MAFPNSVYRRGRYFNGGTADGIVLEPANAATKHIMVPSTLAVVEVVFTPKSATGNMTLFKASRIVATCAGFEIGYNAGSGLLLFVAGNATTATSYLAFKCSWTGVVGRTYRITFTYLANTVYTIVIDELAADGSTINTTSPTVTTELGTSYVTDTGIAYDASFQDAVLGEAANNSMLGNKVTSGFKGAGWNSPTNLNPVNGYIHGIAFERVTAGVRDAEFLLNEQLSTDIPVDATGNSTASLGTVEPSVVAADLAVTELASGSPVTDTDVYSVGSLVVGGTKTIRITNVGDCVAWISAIVDSAGSLGYTSTHALPRWVYPAGTLDLVFTQTVVGGFGGATVSAYGSSGTNTDWSDDVTTFGDFVIALEAPAVASAVASGGRASVRTGVGV